MSKKQTWKGNNNTKYYKHILDNMKIKDEQVFYIKNDKEKDARR